MRSLTSAPLTDVDENQSRLTALLDKFDPELHGEEAMAFAPVGKEFGSQSYDKTVFGQKETDAR
jgi:hypothetical protein